MTERNHLSNGRFLHDLNNWTASGAAYSAGDGDDHYGVAVLSTGGDYIEQTFSIGRIRTYTVHCDVKAVGANLSGSQATLKITDGDGNVLVTQALAGTADTWTENSFEFGLASGTTYTLRLTNVSATGDVKLDDVWLYFVPMSRASLALVVNLKLGRLASNRSLSTAPQGNLSEGDYTYAVDAGLRAFGAINPETGKPDIRYLEEEDIETVLELVERDMLERLQRDYATEVDLAIGPRREALSQTAKMIGQMTGTEGGNSPGKVISKILRHK